MKYAAFFRVCGFAYMAFFVLSMVEVLILERMPYSYIQGQVYSVEDKSYEMVNDRISKLVAQNPSLIKGINESEACCNYIEEHPNHYTECELYIEDLGNILCFSIYETKNGTKISLNGQKRTWDNYDDSYKSTFASLNPDKALSLDELGTLCGSFEKTILSNIGECKKDSLYGVLVWYFYFFQRYILVFGSIFAICMMYILFHFLSKHKSIRI